MSAIPAGKQPCVRCGAPILDETARKTGGLCIPCKEGRREQMDAAAKLYAEERAQRARDEAARAPLAARLAAGEAVCFGDFFHLDDPPYEIYLAALQTVRRDEERGERLERLAPECRTAYVLWCYGGDVESAGFGSYIADASPGWLAEVLAGLEALGAQNQEAALRRALRWVPEALFTEDRELSRRRYVALCEREDFQREEEELRDAFYADWEELYRLIGEYVRAHPDARIARQTQPG
jgi:hypothetical protein